MATTTGRGCASPPGLKQPRVSLGQSNDGRVQQSAPKQSSATYVHPAHPFNACGSNNGPRNTPVQTCNTFHRLASGGYGRTAAKQSRPQSIRPIYIYFPLSTLSSHRLAPLSIFNSLEPSARPPALLRFVERNPVCTDLRAPFGGCSAC